MSDIELLELFADHHGLSLDLENSKFYSDIVYDINEEKELICLKIKGKTDEIDTDQISDFEKLETLELNNLKINNLSFLSNLINLKELDLSQNNIGDISVLSELPNLISLDLSNNTSLNFDFFSQLKQISSLTLKKCNLKNINFLKSLNNLMYLNVLDNQITDLEPLAYLKNLSSINVGKNLISSIKPLLAMEQLRSLWLIHNSIKDYNLLKTKTNITSLSLAHNNVKNISFLRNLRNIKELFLHDNAITDITPISNLLKLRGLNLEKNFITDISPLEKLKDLKDLNLQDNPINELPKWIVNLKSEIDWNPYGVRNNKISLYNNPIKNPPVEIIKQGKQALIRYFEKIEKEGSETIYEVKLTLVGEGSAGKTSLIKRILKKNSALPKRNIRTRGIEIKDWKFKRKGNQTHLAHIWDFGGQDVYYPVHRFFITENSLFLLLASTRQTHHNFDYWIPTIYQFGGKSPIILAQTCHDGNKIAWNDLGTFLGNTNFNIIKTNELPYFELNLPNKNQGLEEIKTVIINQITNLPHYGREVPKSWAIVRELLSIESQKFSCITFDKFKEICLKSNPESFKNSDDYIDCCQFLHDIGVILWYSSNSELKNWVVLEPQWAMNAVYRIIDDQEIQNRKGNIIDDDFYRLWIEEQYVDKHNVLKKMLEVFKIAFPKKHNMKDYIIPARLSSMPSNKKWSKEKPCLRLVYKYDFMPRGMVNQLSAELSRYIVSSTEVWNNAVNFSFMLNQAYCQVEEDFYNRTLTVKSSGKEARSQIILVMDALQNITDGYKGVSPKIFVPCFCSTCTDSSEPESFLYSKLIDWSHKRNHVTCNESGETLSIKDLLYQVGLKNQTMDLDTLFEENNKKIMKVFVSYSKFDEDYLQDFEDHLITLKDEGLISFNCREIKFGVEWDNQIKKEIEECDIMVCLVSVKFLNTDYIKRVEINNAIEQGKIIIPIIIKPCDWESSSIGKFQAAQRGKVVSLDNNKKLLGKIKESTEVEKAAFWTGIIKEFRKKIFIL